MELFSSLVLFAFILYVGLLSTAFASAYLTQLALPSVMDGGTIGYPCQVVEGVHTSS